MATFRAPTLLLLRKTATNLRPRVYLGLRCTTSARHLLQHNSLGRAEYSSVASERPSLAPKVERGGSKVFKNADLAVADLKSGSTILSSGFGLCGVAGI